MKTNAFRNDYKRFSALKREQDQLIMWFTPRGFTQEQWVWWGHKFSNYVSQSYATLTFTVDASSSDHAPDDRAVIIFSADRVTMTVSRWKRIVACYFSLFLLAFTPSVFDAMVTLYGN